MTTEQVVQRLVAQLDYPMVVVTAAADGERAGCLVGFSTQCSVHPPRFLVCISHRNATFPVARRAGVLAVHFLSALSQADRRLAELFGGETADEVDKFSECGWDPGPGGVPLLRDAAGYYVGRVLQRHEAGDHTAFMLDPIAADERRPLAPNLGFQALKDLEPGHEP